MGIGTVLRNVRSKKRIGADELIGVGGFGATK